MRRPCGIRADLSVRRRKDSSNNLEGRRTANNRLVAPPLLTLLIKVNYYPVLQVTQVLVFTHVV